MSNTNYNNNELMLEAGQLACPNGALVGLKKGPWSALEDAILLDYVKKHGEGNWNSVQKNSGLMRCGKSCRLRWANHLRPNLKKSSFTPEEESIIIELHAKLGNKWARMASQLPGRTDNEIKNFWNTRMKRRQRAGLPIYPQEFQAEAAAAFHFRQQQQQLENQQRSHINSSSSSLSSLLSLSRNVTFTPSFSLLDPAINCFSSAPLNPLPNILRTPAFYPNPSQQFSLFDKNKMDDRLALPLSPSPYSRTPCSTNASKENHARQVIPTAPPTLHYNDADFGNNMSFTSLIMGAQVQPIGFFPGLESEFPSDQTPPGSTTSGGGACVVEGSNINKTNDCIDRDAAPLEMQLDNRVNSGLLDALLQESKTLSFKGKSHCEDTLLASGREGIEDEANKRLKLSLQNGSEAFAEKQCDDLSSSQSSSVMKPREEAVDPEMYSMDDDLISLLNNFPSSEQLPDWYHQSRIESNGVEYGGAGDHKCHKTQQDASSLTAGGTINTEAAANLKWESGSCNWKSMPEIC